MFILQFIARRFTSIMMHISLYGFIACLCLVVALSNSANVKQALHQANVYETFTSEIISTATKDAAEKENGIPLDDPAIASIAKSALQPTAVASLAEGGVDSVYQWLEGDQKELSFRLDFTPMKNTFIDTLSTYEANRVVQLRSCTKNDDLNVSVFRLQCRPGLISAEFIKERVSSDLQASEFLKDSVIDVNSLPKTKDGQRFDQRYSFIPTVYQWALRGPYIFAGLFVLFAALFVYARKPFSKGARAFGRDILSSGVSLILLTVVYSYLLPRLTDSFSFASGDKQVTGTNEALNKVVNLLKHRVDITIINVAIQLIAIGLLIVVIERIMRKKNVYASVAKAGVVSGYGERTTQQPVRNQRPPLQTSEVPKRTKVAARKTKKRAL